MGHPLVTITQTVRKCFETLVGVMDCPRLLLLTSYATLNEIVAIVLQDVNFVVFAKHPCFMKAFDTTSLPLSRFML